MKINKLLIILIFIIFIIILFAVMKKFEGEKPLISFALSSGKSGAIGMEGAINGNVSDVKSGIRKLSVVLIKDEYQTILLEENFPKKGLWNQDGIHNFRFNIPIKPKELKLGEGKALLKAEVWDYSWRNSGDGSSASFEKQIVIDMKPPNIDIVSDSHNIRQGGMGLIIYRVSEPCKHTGVKVGDNFFPGYTGGFADKNISMAFFGLDYNQSTDTKMFVEATDYADNKAAAGFHKYLKKTTFASDTIDITENFLAEKMPEFQQTIDLKTKNGSPIEQFLEINRDVRKADFERIKNVCKNSEAKILWDGVFLRLPNSAERAKFAQPRTYKYKGAVIDEQVHLGLDLASLAHSVVPAANSGRVVFADMLGIYGKTVIIDHGFGLFSLYSHLSKIDVAIGKYVKKGDPIGFTGTTGMAGGDHLHFSIFAHDIFVSPIEWFDGTWIQNNITSKIGLIK